MLVVFLYVPNSSCVSCARGPLDVRKCSLCTHPARRTKMLIVHSSRSTYENAHCTLIPLDGMTDALVDLPKLASDVLRTSRDYGQNEHCVRATGPRVQDDADTVFRHFLLSRTIEETTITYCSCVALCTRSCSSYNQASYHLSMPPNVHVHRRRKCSNAVYSHRRTQPHSRTPNRIATTSSIHPKRSPLACQGRAFLTSNGTACTRRRSYSRLSWSLRLYVIANMLFGWEGNVPTGVIFTCLFYFCPILF